MDTIHADQSPQSSHPTLEEIEAKVSPPIKRHPYSKLFGDMKPEELAVLGEGIKQAGALAGEVVMYDGMVLDGWHRYITCLSLGIAPNIVALDQYAKGHGLTTTPAPLDFAVAQNLHRRHLDAGQRAVIADQLVTMKQGQRTDLEPSVTVPKVSQAQAAAMMDVSVSSVGAAKVVREFDPALVKEIQAGKITLHGATKKVRARTHCIHGNPKANCDECCKHGLVKHTCISCNGKASSTGSKPPKSGTLVVVDSDELVAERDEVATAAHREDRKNLQRFMYLIVDLGFRTAAKRSADLKSLEEAKELMVTLVENWKPL